MANEENRSKIIETAIEMFNQEGCRNVTMDQIALRQHISKRTLYETFENKEELVFCCLTEVHRRMGKKRMEIYSMTDDPLLLTLYIIKSTMMQNSHYSKFIYDVEQYYPELNDKIMHIYGDKFTSVLYQLLVNAMKRGDLNKNVDIDNSVKIIVMSVKHLFASKSSQQPEVQNAIKNSIFTYFRGMLSVDAIERYDSKEEEFRLAIGEW